MEEDLNGDDDFSVRETRVLVENFQIQNKHVAGQDIISLLVAVLAAKLGWKIYHFDVKLAFLDGFFLRRTSMLNNLKALLFKVVKTKSISFIKLSMD
jgi:hypothetical protein